MSKFTRRKINHSSQKKILQINKSNLFNQEIVKEIVLCLKLKKKTNDISFPYSSLSLMKRLNNVITLFKNALTNFPNEINFPVLKMQSFFIRVKKLK